MMGLGPIGGGAVGGNSASSTSILSALAPPFTVDRLNPNPNTNPVSHYSNSPYSVQPYYDPWQYPLPSASGPELFVDSVGVTSVPLSDAYGFSAAASTSPSSAHWSATSPGSNGSGCAFGYGGEVEPCYPSYIPSVVGLVEDEGSLDSVTRTCGLSTKSQLDGIQSSIDWDYGPRWVDSLGFGCGKRVKMVEPGGSFLYKNAYVGLSPYRDQLNQGVQKLQNWCNYKEESDYPCQKFNQDSDGKFHAGSFSMGLMKDKSCLEQNTSLFSYDANKACTITSGSAYLPESHSSVVACELPNNFSSYQSTCSLDKQFDKPVEAPFILPLPARRPSPAVVIQSLPATDVNSGQCLPSNEPVHNHGDEFLRFVNLYNPNPSKPKDSGLKLSPNIKQDTFETNLFNFSKQGRNDISPSSVHEVSSFHSQHTFDPKVKATFASQLPDVNALGGFAMACSKVQVVNSAEVSSDFIDHPNPAEDSPCWKGAPSCKISPFGLEVGSSKFGEQNLYEYFQFGHEGLQNLHSAVDSVQGFPEKSSEGNKNHQSDCARKSEVLMLERDINAVGSNKDQSTSDDATDKVWLPTAIGYNGVEIGCYPMTPRKDSGLLNSFTSGFDSKRTGMSPNDSSEIGGVAVLAAENVLASPVSQEDTAESSKPDAKLNVPSLLKAMHNLSDWLLFFLSNGAWSLEDENFESLKHIISNLDSCLGKRIFQETKKPGPNNPVQDTSEKLEDQSSDVGTPSGSSHTVNKDANSHIIEPDSQHMHQKDSCSLPGKKDEKSPISPLLMDDLDITTNYNVSKAIKKVLEENFQLDVEMNSQALLFKSLWLEAEAKLCSISYKARFNRMKVQMETIKSREQEHEDLEETMSKVCISPGMMTASKAAPGAHDGTIPKTTSKYFSNSSMNELADDIMLRLSISKPQEDNLKPINEEPEIVDGEVMARFNALEVHEDNIKSVVMGEEEKHNMVGGEFTDEKNTGSLCIRDQPESETLNVVLDHFLQCQTDILSQGKFGSYVGGTGCESPDEFYVSVTDDPVHHSLNNSTMMVQHNAGGHDSSSSDWEHVLKEDF